MVDYVDKNNLPRGHKSNTIIGKNEIHNKLPICNHYNFDNMIKYFLEVPPEKSFKDQLIDITKMMKTPLKCNVTYSSPIKVEYKVGKHRVLATGDSESICQDECQKKMVLLLQRLHRYIEYSNLPSEKLKDNGIVECREDYHNPNVYNVIDVPAVSESKNSVSSVPIQHEKLPGHISWNEYNTHYEDSKDKDSICPIPGRNGIPPVFVSWNDLATLYEGEVAANKMQNGLKC